VFNTSEGFLPVRKAAGDSIQLLGQNGTSRQLARSTTNISLQSPVSPIEPTPAPELYYLNPNYSTSSISSSSLFFIPTGSLESLANTSEPHSLSMGIAPEVELLTVDTLSTPLPFPPPAYQ
jgi:hypothetical protein